MEYVGCMYERLEMRKNNEFEVMVVLKMGDEDVIVEEIVLKLYLKLKLVIGEVDMKFVRFIDIYDYLCLDRM